MTMQDVVEEKFVTTPSGLKYADKRIGGGAAVSKGLLLVLDYR
jgi:FKBP-type peptidyl-prolyl cis-trans isomerase